MTDSSQTTSDADRATDDNDSVDLLDLLQVLVENLRLLVLGPLLVGLLALAVTFAIKPSYIATAKFLPPVQGQGSAQLMLQSLGPLAGLAGAAAGVKNPNDQFIGFLSSESVGNALIERYNLIDRYGVKFKIDARRNLKTDSLFSSGKDGLISVDFEDEDPVFAAQIANAYVDELGKLLKRLAVTEAQFRRVFFEKQLIETRDKLSAAEKAIRMSGVSSSILRQNADVSIKVVAELNARIAAQEIKLSSLRGFLNEASVEIRQAMIELAALKNQLAKTEASTKPSTDAIGDASDYVALYRNVKYFESLFEFFARQLEAAKTDEAREGAIVQIVDIALVPERKNKPKRAMIAVLSTFGAGVMLIIFVFIHHAYRSTKTNPETFKKIRLLKRSFVLALGRN